MRLPSGSKTGPEVRPSEPESSTETTSVRHENGAASPSDWARSNGAQPIMITTARAGPTHSLPHNLA